MAINKAPHWVLQKELTFDFGQKLKILFSDLLVKIDLYIMFGNILRYSEILSLLGLIERKQKLQGFDQIHGLSL